MMTSMRGARPLLLLFISSSIHAHPQLISRAFILQLLCHCYYFWFMPFVSVHSSATMPLLVLLVQALRERTFFGYSAIAITYLLSGDFISLRIPPHQTGLWSLTSALLLRATLPSIT